MSDRMSNSYIMMKVAELS